MSTSRNENSLEGNKNAVNVREHPLQEVNEGSDDTEATVAATNKTVNKENWVKFDDEFNDDEEGPALSPEHVQNLHENRLATGIPAALDVDSQRLRMPIDGEEDRGYSTTSTSDHDQLSSPLRSQAMSQSQVTLLHLPSFQPNFFQSCRRSLIESPITLYQHGTDFSSVNSYSALF